MGQMVDPIRIVCHSAFSLDKVHSASLHEFVSGTAAPSKLSTHDESSVTIAANESCSRERLWDEEVDAGKVSGETVT